MIDKEIKSSGHTWKSYAETLGQNPSNFKRQFIKNVEKLNKWLSPLNMEIMIIKKLNSKNPTEAVMAFRDFAKTVLINKDEIFEVEEHHDHELLCFHVIMDNYTIVYELRTTVSEIKGADGFRDSEPDGSIGELVYYPQSIKDAEGVWFNAKEVMVDMFHSVDISVLVP